MVTDPPYGVNSFPTFPSRDVEGGLGRYRWPAL